MSTNAIAQKLKMDRRNVRTIFEKFRPEAIKPPTPKADDPATTIKLEPLQEDKKESNKLLKRWAKKQQNKLKQL